MKINKEEIPITMQDQTTTMRALSGYGGMTISYKELPAGTDFTPLLQGLKNNSCHCPHWGYVVEGSVRLIYDDGTEETVNSGDVFFWPPGHIAIVEKDLKLIDFSPEKEFFELMDHVAKKMADISD